MCELFITRIPTVLFCCGISFECEMTTEVVQFLETAYFHRGMQLNAYHTELSHVEYIHRQMVTNCAFMSTLKKKRQLTEAAVIKIGMKKEY